MVVFKPNVQNRALLAAAVTGILVGAAMVATSKVASVIPAVSLAFLRYSIGLMWLTAFVAGRRFPTFSGRDIFTISILGIGQFAVLVVLLNIALRTLAPGPCALIFSVMPVVTMLFAVALRRERITLTRTSGMALGLAGVALSIGPKLLRWSGPGETWPAVLAVVAATTVGALCSVLYRPYLRRYPTLQTSAIAMLASVVALTVTCLKTAAPLIPRLDATEWLYVAFIGTSSGIGYYCWLWALAKIDASRVAGFQALSPITAAVIGLAVEHRSISGSLAAAIVCVFFGLYLIQRPAQRLKLVRSHRTTPL